MAKKSELTVNSLTIKWLRMLDYGGFNPLHRKKVTPIICIMINTAMVFSLILNGVYTKFTNISQISENIVSVCGYFVISLKMGVLFLKYQIVTEMLKIVWTKFWQLDSVDHESRSKLLKNYKIINIVTLIYFWNYAIAVLSFAFGSLVKGDRSLPVDMWVPNKDILKESPYYEIASFAEIMTTYFLLLLCAVPFDCLFIVMIGLAYCQLNMIKVKLLEVGNDEKIDNFNRIRECVKHHNLILRFLESLEDVYSMYYMVLVAAYLPLLTLCMYGVVVETDVSRKFSFGSVGGGILLQFYFYCQTGQLIQDQVSGVGYAAYHCSWYNIPNVNEQKSLIMIIARSQRRFNITLGGFMVLNLETFSSVVKASFSFLTFLQQVKS